MNTVNTPHSNETENIAASEIDFLPYLSALIDARWWLVLIALVGALLSGIWAFSKPYLYESSAKVSIVDIEDPGGVSPDDRRASEVLTLVEHGFVMGTTRDNYDAVIIARLKSRDFTTLFLEQYNIYRHFYPQHWNNKEEKWENGFEPDRGESLVRFREEVRAISLDEETDIITIAMRWHEADLASEMANLYVKSFNEFIREKTQKEVQRKQEFLQEELLRSDIVDIQQSIYRLIEAQTAIAMLASAREEYVLEVIDPAAKAFKSYTMSRKKKIVLGAFATTLIGVFAVLALVLARGMLQTIIKYRESEAITNKNNSSKKERNI